jgi:rhodanese-related sulfurtransferase
MVRLWIAVVLMVAAACSGGTGEAPSISPAELQAQRESGSAPVVIDVRSDEEYAGGHIPGAVHIPYEQIAERIGEVDTSKGVALYCMIGPRARKGEAALIAAGHDRVFHIEGGFSAWKAAGLPTALD